MIRKKITKLIIAGIIIFVLGGIGGIVFDKYLVPFLGSCKFLSGYDFFQKSGKDITIIKETERIIIKDDNSVNELAFLATQSVVDIIAIEKIQANNALVKKNRGKKGTGTILTNDGVIVTHQENVFRENAKYFVTIFDGTVFEAEFVGIDNFSELAFLQIKEINLPAIPFANSDNVIIGKKIIALGGSIGNQQISIAEGNLSDYDKTFNLVGANLASSEKLEGVFKLSCNGNNNFVGGPVINYNGELIAITSVIEVDNKREYFQIPSNKIKVSMNKVFSEDVKKTAKLGIYYISIDNFYSRLNNLSVDEGAIVYSASGSQGLAVIVGSVAAKAGIQINDIVISVNGEKINLKNSLSSYVNKYKIGDKVELEIIRGGENIKIEAIF